ncbi:MAG: hypothetical protein SFW64_02425 [Alphaproteobacteria bacterium]|nr:hypothetical protein [Alphaproteobacteria bacterium]
MVSTEANNTDWQAATRAFGDLPADARAEALSAVAWMQPTPPRPTGFAQAAAVAYLHDAPAALPLTLASSHPAAESAAESAVSARDIAQILNEVSAICTTAGVPVHELTMLLDKIKSSVGVKSLDAIRNDALNEAQALVVTAGAKAGELAETAAEMNERLWGEIGKLNEEIVDTLSPHMTEEEKKREEEFKRRLEAATSDEERAQIMQEQNKFHEGVRERLEHGHSSAGRAAAAITKPKIEKVDEDLERISTIQERKSEKNKNAFNSVISEADLGAFEESTQPLASTQAVSSDLGNLPAPAAGQSAKSIHGIS